MNTLLKKVSLLCFISLGGVNLANAAAATVSWAPVPVDLTNKSTLLAQRGAYLVRLINCASCHSTVTQKTGTDAAKDGWNVTPEYYLSGGKVQQGAKVANLTPDALGNPAGLSLKQFKAAIKQGVSSIDSSKKIVSMPWPNYAEMTDTDVKAIYEYLRSIPPLAMGPATAPTTTGTATGTTTGTTGTTTGTTGTTTGSTSSTTGTTSSTTGTTTTTTAGH
jgi:hypothetical protein